MSGQLWAISANAAFASSTLAKWLPYALLP